METAKDCRQIHPEPERVHRAQRDLLLEHDNLNQEGSHLHWQPNVMLSTYEAVRGWGELFLHRKTVVFIEGRDPFLAQLSQRLVREGFKLKSFKASEKEALLQFIVEQQKTILCVLYTEWHWLFETRIWSSAETLAFQETLEQNKILSVNLNFFLAPEIQFLHAFPFTLQIFDLKELGSIAIGRAKSKYSSWLLELGAQFSTLPNNMRAISDALAKSIHLPGLAQRELIIKEIERSTSQSDPQLSVQLSGERLLTRAFFLCPTQTVLHRISGLKSISMCEVTDKSLLWIGDQLPLQILSRLGWIDIVESGNDSTAVDSKLTSSYGSARHWKQILKTYQTEVL